MIDAILLSRLDRFIKGPEHLRQQWIHGMYASVYFRKSYRFLGHLKTQSIDVANIEVHKPKFRGQGVFTGLLDHLERLNQLIVVECIQEPRLIPFLQKRGYVVFPHSNGQSYYKLPSGTLTV